MGCEDSVGNKSILLIKQGAEARVYEFTFAVRRRTILEDIQTPSFGFQTTLECCSLPFSCFLV
ncbi:unnamed protein product [Arabidopsis halleri]